MLMCEIASVTSVSGLQCDPLKLDVLTMKASQALLHSDSSFPLQMSRAGIVYRALQGLWSQSENEAGQEVCN